MTRFSKPRRLLRGETLSEFYYVRVNEDGRRSWRSTGQSTLELAKEVVRKWTVREAKGELHVEDAAFDTSAQSWLDEREARVSPGCHRVYKVYVNHWKRHFGAKRLRTVEHEDLEKFLRQRKATGLAPRSLNDERATLRRFFSWALDRGLVVRNPMKRIDRFRETKRKIRTLETKEEGKLLQAAGELGEEFCGSVLCLMRSGLRRGTVAQLEWPDVDFDAGEWKIPAAKMKAREDFVGRPVAPDLLAWLRARARTSGPVFGRLEAKKWAAAVEASGLSRLRPHDLRRSFVTRCRRAGIPMEVTMFLSDHRDVKVVLECYREVDPREAREAMAKLHGKPAARRAQPS